VVVHFGFAVAEPDFRRRVAKWLEDGTIASSKVGFLARALARAHTPIASRTLARKLDVPASVVTVTVGGATIGGSGKTRVAVACAKLFAKEGAEVALIGHGYRAKPGEARVVTPACELEEVGDEALACVRALARSGVSSCVRVIVADSRQRAVDVAMARRPLPDVLVIDGPLTLRPRRADLALLAVDSEHPWGSGLLLPAGDLRAPPNVLLGAADMLVVVDATPALVFCRGHAEPLSCLRGMRLGFFSAMARPRRLLSALARANVLPSVAIHAPDHGPLSRVMVDRILHADANVEMWLASEKCALHLERLTLHQPIATFESTTTLPDIVDAHARSLAAYARMHALTLRSLRP
jgi:tetraacyldisaccharide 4'-kinase